MQRTHFLLLIILRIIVRDNYKFFFFHHIRQAHQSLASLQVCTTPHLYFAFPRLPSPARLLFRLDAVRALPFRIGGSYHSWSGLSHSNRRGWLLHPDTIQALPFESQCGLSRFDGRMRSPLIHIGGSLLQTAWELSPIESQCELYVWAQWGLSLSESLCDSPCS